MPVNDIWFMVVFFIFGGILMILELIMPGFSVPGIAGILSLIAGVVVGSSVLTSGQLAVVIFLVFVATIVMAVLLYRSATRNGKLSRLLFLSSSAVKEEGYSSNKSLEDMIGRIGTSTTILRPSGSGDFDGIKVDVIADGQFIPKDTKIKIVKVEGFRILVEQIYKDITDEH